MKKFPTIRIRDDEPPSPPKSPKAERKTEENIFVTPKETPKKKEKSAKQLAHLETIRAKALKARQDKAKTKKAEAPAEEPAEVGEVPQTPKGESVREPQVLSSAVKTYTHAEVEDIIRKTASGIYEKEKEKRIAEVRNKQVELEQKSFNINGLLRKGGRTRW